MDGLDWVINGVRPFNIVSMEDMAFPKITLHCAAHYTDTRYNAPIDEINVFKAMACNTIINEPTQSGGTDVQTSMDNTIIPISNGTDNWLGALYYPQYTPDNMAETLIEFDLIFELGLVNKAIIPDTPSPPDITKPYNLITQGYGKTISTIGVETDLLGTFTFNWDGTGHVYVASDWQADPETDLICIDDRLIVTNENGESFTRDCNPGGVFQCESPIDITSFLEEGDNEISFKIQDIYGAKIGTGPLFLIQV